MRSSPSKLTGGGVNALDEKRRNFGLKVRAEPPTNGKRTAQKSDPFDPGITLADLLAADLPAPRFVIPRALPEGLSILAGRPKQGKSWLAMLHAICTAGGIPCFGERVEARDVLHLALEDTRCRYRDRARKMLAALGAVNTDRLDVRTNWPRAGSGGLARLAEWFSEHRGGLVILDTLARFRDPSKGRGSYEEDYLAVSSLKGLADEYGAGIEVVTHTRKGAADDRFDEVSGTLGINGAADALMVLDRQRGADAAALYLTGRDLPDETLTLAWGRETGLWSLQSRADGIERPDHKAAPPKVDQCIAFLKTFLTAFAFPDTEILAAAKRQGFTFDDVKEAKTQRRKGDPPLVSHKRGFGVAMWWNWIGRKPRPDRPEAAVEELMQSDIPQNPHNGEPLENKAIRAVGCSPRMAPEWMYRRCRL
jgi:hypothetical protein